MTKRARQSELRRSTKSIDLLFSTSDVSDADVAEVLAPSSVAQSFWRALASMPRRIPM